MSTKRTQKITSRVFTKKDISSLWDMVFNENKKIKLKHRNLSRISIVFKTDDGYVYDEKTGSQLKDGDIIDTKRCSNIDIRFRNYEVGKSINISLVRGLSTWSNFEVEGDSREWVVSTFEKINDYIKSVKIQNHWIVKYKQIIYLLGSIGLGYLLISTISNLFLDSFFNLNEGFQIEDTPTIVLFLRSIFITYPIGYYLIQTFLYYLSGSGPFYWIFNWVLKSWPDIEFDFGPEHMNLEKERRNKLILMAIFVFPYIPFIHEVYTMYIK